MFEDMRAPPSPPLLDELRARIARIEGHDAGRPQAPVLPFGVRAIDGHLPAGGLACAALHEIGGAGPEVEHGAAAALLIAGLLARTRGSVLWIMQQPDLFGPGLAGVGLDPDRVIFVEAGKSVLPVMEDGLRHRGLAGVVGEAWGRLGLTASRRLQLAAEASGGIAFALRRSRDYAAEAVAEPTAALTRWRIVNLPSLPPLAYAPDTPGLARPRWRLDLLRCRGGVPHSWLVEGCDEEGHLALVTDVANEPAAPREAGSAA